MEAKDREWKPWIEKKGYQDAVYDFSVDGKNREILKEYWRESVEQNRDFEVSYTLGMRGIHDSGFETQKLNGLEGEELFRARISKVHSGAEECIAESSTALLLTRNGWRKCTAEVPPGCGTGHGRGGSTVSDRKSVV